MAEFTDVVPLPPHAYVPGQSPRHAEDWFDGIKNSVSPAMDADALARSRAFEVGMAYLDEGYFWECHEVLEAVWMALPEGSAERKTVQAIIQLANARLKLRMKRPRATLRLCDIADGHLEGLEDANPVLGVRIDTLRARIRRTRNLTKDAL